MSLSALVGLTAAAVVFGLWFPYPYRALAGGQHLFLVLVSVDVVCGPLLTAVLFSPFKSRREMALDLSLIALVQLGALVYGVHAISEARPVVAAFESDRLVAVSAAQIDPADLGQAPPDLRKLSWSGPVLIGTRAPKDGETFASVMMSVQGVEPSARPGWWQSYDQSRDQVKQRMKKLADLRAARDDGAQREIDAAAAKSGLPLPDLYYLPLTSQKMLDGWIVLLDSDGRIVGYAPVDGF
ncbi:fimb protein [Ramlibacter alkalitolerans]